MANRCPHLSQTTVPMEVELGATSVVPRRRLAVPFKFTSAALDVAGNCPGRLPGRRRGIRPAAFVAWLRSR
jgi:hypothetical protein